MLKRFTRNDIVQGTSHIRPTEEPAEEDYDLTIERDPRTLRHIFSTPYATGGFFKDNGEWVPRTELRRNTLQPVGTGADSIYFREL